MALCGSRLARAAAALSGGRLRLAAPGDGALFRLVLYGLAGVVALHLLLTGLDLAGLAWDPWLLAALWAAVIAAASLVRPERARRAADERTRLPSDLGWGDGLALVALLVFALFALTLWITIPDFVYHWGLKGHRFFLARGIDYPYLTRGWNWVIHPDYPNLLPELFAVTALCAGTFDEPAAMLWSVAFFALLLGAVREALRQAGSSRFVLQAATALVALVAAAAGIGGMMAGGADWMIALALAAALPPLMRPPDRSGDLQIGVIAAFAAASKVEGLPLAVILLALQWLRPGRTGARGDSGSGSGAGTPPRSTAAVAERAAAAAALLVPVAAVALPWLAAVHRHHLFQDFNSGPFDPARAPAVGGALLAMLAARSWHGFTYGLFLLPLLALDRRLRPAAAALLCQVVFYLYVYFSARVDPVALVLTSFPRLALHLLPAILTGAAIVLDGLSVPRKAPPA
ncbi:MAG TPA: hypothetical protein VHR45_23810 [Thermoanaerobaculia bacterium]|nr:hypothetical protein [Thermoanaerobaculia bacterium]